MRSLSCSSCLIMPLMLVMARIVAWTTIGPFPKNVNGLQAGRIVIEPGDSWPEGGIYVNRLVKRTLYCREHSSPFKPRQRFCSRYHLHPRVPCIWAECPAARNVLRARRQARRTDSSSIFRHSGIEQSRKGKCLLDVSKCSLSSPACNKSPALSSCVRLRSGPGFDFVSAGEFPT